LIPYGFRDEVFPTTTLPTYRADDRRKPTAKTAAQFSADLGLPWAASAEQQTCYKPSAPSGLTASAGTDWVVLTWADPSDTEIVGYQYRQRVEGGAWGAWTNIPGSGADTVTHTVADLTMGAVYSFQIRARANVFGDASPEASATVVDTVLPAKPAGFRAVPSHEAAVLLWSDPSDLSLTGYQYRVGSGAWTDIPASNAATVRHVVTGLTNNRSYTFRVRAVDTGGMGPQSDAVRVKIGLAAPEAQTVEVTSELVPEGLRYGARFRLLFVTSDVGYALPTGLIMDSNDKVQAAAAGNPLLAPFRDYFRAVVSTADVDARVNTATAYTSTDKGVPVYWVGGDKVADDYADFYDGSWDSKAWKTENGNQAVVGGSFSREVWTGSDADGTKHADNPAGAASVRYGWLGNNPVSDGTSGLRTTGNRLAYYGLSPVFTVADTVRPAAPAELSVFASDGGAALAWARTDDKTVRKYQVRHRAGSGAWSGWADVAGSDAGTVWHDVAGLANGVVNTIELRAVDYVGPGAAARATVTPSAVVSAGGPGKPVWIASDSALARALGGVGASGEFRLLFATSVPTSAEVGDIRYYNRHVQDVAANNPLLAPFKDGFRAVVSTADIDAEYNTGVSYAVGGPDILWMNGENVTYSRFQPAFYSGAWQTRQPLDENARPYNGGIFTGTAEFGFRHPSAHVGAASVVTADTAKSRLDGPVRPAGEELAVYALSPVIRVRERIDDIAVTPGDGQLAVDWDNVGAAVDYEVRWRTAGGSWQSQMIDPGLATAYTITGLAAGTAYQVEVRYRPGEYKSRYIESYERKRFDSGSKQADGNGDLTVSWTRPRGLVYSHVRWWVANEGWVESGRIGPGGLIDPADDNPVGWNPRGYPNSNSPSPWERHSYTITGLTPNKVYKVDHFYEVPARGYTPVGEARATTTGTATAAAFKLGRVQGLKEAKKWLRGMRTDGIYLQWRQQTDAEGYVLQWKPKNGAYSTDRQVTLTGQHNTRYRILNNALQPNQRYQIRVRAIREGATPGNWSQQTEAQSPA